MMFSKVFLEAVFNKIYKIRTSNFLHTNFTLIIISVLADSFERHYRMIRKLNSILIFEITETSVNFKLIMGRMNEISSRLLSFGSFNGRISAYEWQLLFSSIFYRTIQGQYKNFVPAFDRLSTQSDRSSSSCPNTKRVGNLLAIRKSFILWTEVINLITSLQNFILINLTWMISDSLIILLILILS